MMATKPMTTLRDRALSPSSPLHHSSPASRAARPSTKTPLPGIANVSPPAKKAMPKTTPSSEPPPRRISTAPSTTTTASSSTQSVGRSANKAQLPSNPAALQKSLNSISPTPKPSSISRLSDDKVIQTVTRTRKTSPVCKTKSTSSAPVKKKEASVIIPAPFRPANLSTDHEAAVVIDRSMEEQSSNDPKNVVKAFDEQNDEEEIKFISSLIEEDNHIENRRGGEPELRKELLEPQLFDEISNHQLVFNEFPKEAGVVIDAETLEKRGEGEKVEVVTRQVQPEVERSRIKTAVAPMVAARTLAGKNKDAPRSNDVIEKTKSMLLGARKSRVLALVGAFETVMSQQEPNSQPIQKAHQVQHCQKIQQVEQSHENQQYPLCGVIQRKQEGPVASIAEQLREGDETHGGQQSHENVEHQENGNEEDTVMVKEEEANEALKTRNGNRDELLKDDEAQEIREAEDVMVKDEEDDKALQNSEREDDESTESM